MKLRHDQAASHCADPQITGFIFGNVGWRVGQIASEHVGLAIGTHRNDVPVIDDENSIRIEARRECAR
ncbi:MAG TPA: hypothetical protein VHD62_16130 [Opitutaceae bacterium]|nr:hypothetical protein [Opitutaceae bacterium]